MAGSDPSRQSGTFFCVIVIHDKKMPAFWKMLGGICGMGYFILCRVAVNARVWTGHHRSGAKFVEK